MTPAAREAAAIDLLDRWLAGHPVEQALTHWARASRFAGSGDRESVRDLVFQAVRCRRSAAALGGGETGRALLLGLARADGITPQGWTGEGHAPAALSDAEGSLFTAALPVMDRAVALDCQDWILDRLEAALGGQVDPVLSLMRNRAPVFVRVNLATATRAAVIDELTSLGIAAKPHALANTAVEITANSRRLRNSDALAAGRIELQDAASQAIALDFASHATGQVLDYCAGGGGKALALAAAGFSVSAHDVDPRRMVDLPARAKRASARVQIITGVPRGTWPAIFADVPCSGSGSWRRAPEAKWAFTPERLTQLTALQDDILRRCADLTAPGGLLGYATCSMLHEENEDRVKTFLKDHPGWDCSHERRLSPLDGGDGFYLALLKRNLDT